MFYFKINTFQGMDNRRVGDNQNVIMKDSLHNSIYFVCCNMYMYKYKVGL